MNDESRVVHGFLRRELPAFLCVRDCRLGVEVGVQDGDHAKALLSGWPGKLMLVDCWCNYDPGHYVDMANVSDDDHKAHYRRCLEQMAPFGDRVKIVPEFSLVAAGHIPDRVLDFVYLDANHAYRSVMDDLYAWWPKLRVNGIMAGHDFTVDAPPREGNVFGVKPAVLDFCKTHGIAEVFVGDEEWPTWLFPKTIGVEMTTLGHVGRLLEEK